MSGPASWHRVGHLVTLRVDLPPGVMSHARELAAVWAVAIPEPGSVYTIRAVVADPTDGTVCFRVEEIVNPELPFDDMFGEAMFPAAAFRPVNTPSIESLRPLLSPSREERRRVFEEIVEEAAEARLGAGWWV